MARRLKESDAECCCIEICGNRLTVRYKQREHSFKYSVGLRYIIELIINAGITISAAGLASLTAQSAPIYEGISSKSALLEHGLSCMDGFSAMPMTDAVSIKEIKGRLLDIVAELAEMDANCDYGRADDLREEQEALVRYLKEVYRPDQRIRCFASEQQKQGRSVRKSIKRALAQILAVDAELGAKLAAGIRTGKDLVYEQQELDIRISFLKFG